MRNSNAPQDILSAIAYWLVGTHTSLPRLAPVLLASTKRKLNDDDVREICGRAIELALEAVEKGKYKSVLVNEEDGSVRPSSPRAWLACILRTASLEEARTKARRYQIAVQHSLREEVRWARRELARAQDDPQQVERAERRLRLSLERLEVARSTRVRKPKSATSKESEATSGNPLAFVNPDAEGDFAERICARLDAEKLRAKMEREARKATLRWMRAVMEGTEDQYPTQGALRQARRRALEDLRGTENLRSL